MQEDPAHNDPSNPDDDSKDEDVFKSATKSLIDDSGSVGSYGGTVTQTSPEPVMHQVDLLNSY